MQSENLDSKARMSRVSRPFLVTLILLVIAVGVGTYYYLRLSGEISRDNDTISSLQSQVSSLQG